jgi:hypothetical protein
LIVSQAEIHARERTIIAAMARRLRKRTTAVVLFYAVVTLAIAASFAWQMVHGICPVP